MLANATPSRNYFKKRSANLTGVSVKRKTRWKLSQRVGMKNIYTSQAGLAVGLGVSIGGLVAA